MGAPSPKEGRPWSCEPCGMTRRRRSRRRTSTSSSPPHWSSRPVLALERAAGMLGRCERGALSHEARGSRTSPPRGRRLKAAGPKVRSARRKKRACATCKPWGPHMCDLRASRDVNTQSCTHPHRRPQAVPMAVRTIASTRIATAVWYRIVTIEIVTPFE